MARKKKLFLMEAVWTRFFPIAKEIRESVKSGKLGQIKRVFADLSFWNDVEKEFGTEHRMVNLDLAGGALLDCKYNASACLLELTIDSGHIFSYLGIPTPVPYRTTREARPTKGYILNHKVRCYGVR
jgi:predicted dehydrogenase